MLRAAFADRIEPPRALVDRRAFPLLEICPVDLGLGERPSDGELVGFTQTRQVEGSELHDDVARHRREERARVAHTWDPRRRIHLHPHPSRAQPADEGQAGAGRWRARLEAAQRGLVD